MYIHVHVFQASEGYQGSEVLRIKIGRGWVGWVEAGKGGEKGDIHNSVNNKNFKKELTSGTRKLKI